MISVHFEHLALSTFVDKAQIRVFPGLLMIGPE